MLLDTEITSQRHRIYEIVIELLHHRQGRRWDFLFGGDQAVNKSFQLNKLFLGNLGINWRSGSCFCNALWANSLHTNPHSVTDTCGATRSPLGPWGVTVVPMVRSFTMKLGTWSLEQCDPKVEHSRIPALQTYNNACNYCLRE